jgi:HEAT repeat protein
LAADPGRGNGAAGSLRGDVDAAVAQLGVLGARFAALDAELRALDQRVAAAHATPPSSAGVEQIAAVAKDLKDLRDALAAELSKVEARLADIRRRVDEQNAPRPTRDGPLSEEEENDWAARARDADPGVRFSALTLLGRKRTERSVHVSVELLLDEESEVVWQALRNLGRFKERAEAKAVAALLGHADVAVRAAAFDALLAMGAPKDTGFDALASPDARKSAAEKLKKWAETP